MKIKRGFKAVKEEEKRREEERKNRQGKLWRVFFPKNAGDDFEIPIRFLTDEPICYYEHTKNVAGKWQNYLCTGEGCPHCADGDKPRFVGAFLVIDRTEFEYDERDDKGNKTGRKLKGKDRLKLLVRGQTDLASLDRLNSKYGLLDRDWAVYKTGSGTSTKWNFDRGDVDEWTEEELQNILPEKYRGRDFYDILEEQITGESLDESDSEDDITDEEVEEKVTSGVQSLDDEDEEDAPKKARSSKKGATKKLKRK
jgi:hypothetical protein